MIDDPGRRLTVAVHGLGYVGTVSAACLADQGHRVVGVDVVGDKVDQLNAGIAPVLEPGLTEIVSQVVADGRLVARRHTDEVLTELTVSADVHLVCVGTPSTANGSPDDSAGAAVIDEIVAPLQSPFAGEAHPIIVVRSTVLPGTVDRLGRDVENRTGLRAGRDFGLAMCPEFLREASAVQDFLNPPFTVAGVSEARTESVIEALFAFTGRPFHSVAIPTAECIKYACNAFHALKVAFANEIGRWSQASGAHGQSVMDILCRDQQLNISPAYLRPGFAFGGSCLPKDLRALTHHGRRLDVDLPLLESVLGSNDHHLDHTVRLLDSYRPNRVALLGLTFKTGTDDLRESPYVRVAERLIGRGLDLTIWDPDLGRAGLRGANLTFVEEHVPHLARRLRATPGEAIERADVALLGTSHTEALAALGRRPDVPVVDAEGSLSADVRNRVTDYVGVAW